MVHSFDFQNVKKSLNPEIDWLVTGAIFGTLKWVP